uniref:Serine carboxypeptidase n=1 Tax=Timema monikensis TaxID=170555 RepID=A0A7R9HNX2_9NEOP|nr:unnamed protein product [Timema monikensis]
MKKAWNLLFDSKNGFFNLTGFDNYYNYLHDRGSSLNGSYDIFVQKTSTRKAIHVGNSTFHTIDKVQNFLREDFAQSVKPWVEELLESYRMVVYNGQLDIVVAYPLTLTYLQALQWSGAALYKTAPRYKWQVGHDLAGFTKTVGKLTEVLVRDAGHMVPGDQPKWALDLIYRLTTNKPFH